MKKTDIIKCLKANKQISDYEITIKNKESRELFYVLKHLEINRAVNVEEAAIEIYVDKKDKKGNSCVFITAADNTKTLKAKLSAAVKKATSAMNKYYPLANKTTNIKDTQKKKLDLNKVATEIAKAVYKAETNISQELIQPSLFVSAL